MGSMWIRLFLNLLLAHLVGDFLLQTDSLCAKKRERRFSCGFLYVHSLIIAALSLLAFWNSSFWPWALAIGAAHFIIDGIKACVRKDSVWLFVSDQLFHIIILAVVAYICVERCAWTDPDWLTDQAIRVVAVASAAMICWKPANILIRYILQYCKMVIPADNSSLFHAGKLIGTLERWLILSFLVIGRYEVIGFLIAAKSIIRFGEKDKDQTEYFLAGTLLSISIAVACGLVLGVIV